jgi:peptide/nickel transport system substrate-binding protein
MTLEELIIVQSSVETGDPHQCSDSSDKNSVLSHIFEPLIKRDEKGKFRPCLAFQWNVQPDGLTWIFRLRENIFFHNGVRLRARDIVSNLERIVDPSTGGSFGTEGVYASYLSEAKFTARSDEIFTITTPEPMPDLLDLLSEMPMGYGEAMDKLPVHYIGTGAYRVASRKSDEIELELFKNYWDMSPPVNELVWIREPDALRRVEMVLERDADIGSNIGFEGVRLTDSSSRVNNRKFAGWLCIIFLFNMFQSVCRDKRIRQALNYALDKKEIIRYAMNGTAEILNGFLTPHHFGYNHETESYSYNPERARNLLLEAGYSDGFKLEVDIPSSMPDEAPKLAEIISKYYSQVGIEVNVEEYYDRQKYAEMVKEKRIHDLCCFDSSPKSTFRVLREKLISVYKGPWWQGYHNPEVNKLFIQATKTFDYKEREKIYQIIYAKITDDAPWLFLYRPYFFWAVNSRANFWYPGNDGLTTIK